MVPCQRPIWSDLVRNPETGFLVTRLIHVCYFLAGDQLNLDKYTRQIQIDSRSSFKAKTNYLALVKQPNRNKSETSKMFQRRRGGQGGNFGVMLLALQLMNFGFDKIPPVTLVAIVSQAAIFLGIGDLTRWFPSSSGVCLSTHFVWRQGQWNRLILGQLFHATDMHLYFNMVSLLWKGNMLERKFKSVYFAYLLTVFTILTGIMIVGLNFVLSEVLDDRTYELQCAVGFSGKQYYKTSTIKFLMIAYSNNRLIWAFAVC